MTKVNMYKHIRNFFALSFLCTAASAVALSACDAPGDGASPESQPALRTPAELGLGEGWVEQEEGLWSRIGADGQEEFVGVGEPGKMHGLASLHAAEEHLALAAEAEDTEEAKARLAEIRELIVDIEDTEFVAASEDPSFRCQAQLTHFALASGAACNSVKADASVIFNNYCNSATETIYTYTYATCGVVTTTHSCGPKTGTSIGCGSHSYLTSATSSCESYAYAASNSYSTWQLNNVKGYCEPTTPPSCGPCSAGYDCHCGDFEGCVPRNQTCN
ncbi:hypothetical protein [Nannocystis radixulma]|uniref:Uncharacterized protein n=1 Tax=Nannocystis radixulma TaxID=2995305 RepID=A0ABT5BG30_9BACT|nr:hypothetical protein [Nannocystis radixulma]MDC0672383.1 hypothetical protein [Nannocystis radixulma]